MFLNKNYNNLFSTANIFLWPLVVFVVFFITFIIVNGGPITNDELKYLALSLDTTQEPRILNRYFHIYFQKFFVYYLNDPFVGMQIFWSFIISSTAALTFYSAILISNSKSLAIGFLSLLFLLIQPLIFRFNGVTYADYTVMLILALSMAIYVSTDMNSLRSKSKSIFILSALLILSIKSKETGIVNIVFIIGIIASNLKISSIFRLSLCGVIGILSGIFLMALLDAFILGDYLFSWRFSNIEQLFSFNSGGRERVIGNWYSLISETDLIIPFFLYLLSLPYIIDKEKPSHIKFLYLLPIFIVLFLTITSGFGRLRIVPRYIVPIIPIISILAANYIQLSGISIINKLKLSKRSFFWSIIFVIFLMSVAYFLRNTSNLINLNGWTPRLFLSNIFYPMVISLILIFYIFLKKNSNAYKVLFLSLFVISILPPLIAIPNNVLFSGKLFDSRIYPLETFRNNLKINKNTVLILSGGTLGFSGGLIPFYFDVKISCSDRGNKYPILCASDENKKIYSNYFNDDGMVGKDGRFDYAILTINKYEQYWETSYPSDTYNIIRDDDKKYVLICKNKICNK